MLGYFKGRKSNTLLVTKFWSTLSLLSTYILYYFIIYLFIQFILLLYFISLLTKKKLFSNIKEKKKDTTTPLSNFSTNFTHRRRVHNTRIHSFHPSVSPPAANYRASLVYETKNKQTL